jgi:DnaJ domain
MMNRDKEYVDLVVVTVLISLVDRTTITGNMHKPRTRTLLEFMNYPAQFIEIERKDGSHVDLAKTAIRTIEPYEAPRANQLAQEMQKFESFEPHDVLGVAKGAPREQVRDAYLKMQRMYHPDRYTGTELPSEVADYINAIARRVNIAYSILSERGRAAN